MSATFAFLENKGTTDRIRGWQEEGSDARIPQFVPPLGTTMEVLVVAPVKVVQPVGRVVRSVRVHNVEQDGQAESVRRVDQLFELFRRACPRVNRSRFVCQLESASPEWAGGAKGKEKGERTVTTTDGKEARDLVSERGIVRMLHDGPVLPVQPRRRESAGMLHRKEAATPRKRKGAWKTHMS